MIRLLAENANAYVPLGPGEELVDTGRFALWLGRSDDPESTVAQRFRLKADEVEPTVEEVRRIVRERGRRASTWEVADSATPPDLVERLERLGIVPFAEEPVAVGMVLTEEPPAAPPGVEARRVEGFEEYVLAHEIAFDVFGMPKDRREAALARAKDVYGESPNEGYLAFVDGEPVGMGTARFTDAAAVLYAGSVLPHARGRGAYRALVRARWDAAVARGTPALVTHAGSMSLPILRRLGFREVATIRILIDEAS
ncbi:MAG TPA: GNAT family N-acetyltransferase [Gaiellaceae bacterium]